MDNIPWVLIIIILINIFGKKLKVGEKFGEWLEILSNSNKYQKVVFSVWVTISLFLGMYFGFQETDGEVISGILMGSFYSLIIGALLFIPMIILLAIWREK